MLRLEDFRPNLDNSLNEAIKAFRRPGSMLNICIYVENVGEYKEQIIFYKSLKELGNKSGINISEKKLSFIELFE